MCSNVQLGCIYLGFNVRHDVQLLLPSYEGLLAVATLFVNGIRNKSDEILVRTLSLSRMSLDVTTAQTSWSVTRRDELLWARLQGHFKRDFTAEIS